MDKGYGLKRIMIEFMRSGTFCKSEFTAAGSVTSKERLTEEWRHIDHGIIDRAANQGICLFVCLGFNGTFSTNRLYRAITVDNMSRRGRRQHKYIIKQ